MSNLDISLEMGAEIWLGKDLQAKDKDPAKIFKFQGYFGFDPSDPTETFLFARSYGADLTVENFAEAFDLTTDLPPPLKRSGFKGELLVSYSATGGYFRRNQVTVYFEYF